MQDIVEQRVAVARSASVPLIGGHLGLSGSTFEKVVDADIARTSSKGGGFLAMVASKQEAMNNRSVTPEMSGSGGYHADDVYSDEDGYGQSLVRGG